MGTRLGKMTAYQAIPYYTRSLSVYSCSSIDKMDELITAMRTWNLHGSANKIESWKEKMRKCIEAEHQEYTWEIPTSE